MAKKEDKKAPAKSEQLAKTKAAAVQKAVKAESKKKVIIYHAHIIALVQASDASEAQMLFSTPRSTLTIRLVSAACRQR